MKEKVLHFTATDTEPCRICAKTAHYFGALDFGISGNDAFIGMRTYPDTGILIHYFRCSGCGLIFTPSFDRFSAKDFKDFIYNDTYIAADPPFTEERPARDTEMLDILLQSFKKESRILDYGGGTGTLTRKLRERGFSRVDFIDPFYAVDVVAGGKADIITCFEVVEHIPDQKRMLNDILSYMMPDSVLIFSTQLQPSDILSVGVKWWYVMPRNGHISLHTSDSLTALFEGKGLQWKTLTQDLHMAWYPQSRIAEKILKNQNAIGRAGAFRNPLPPS